MKNGEKSDFWGHFWEGSVDFGPNFYLCNTNIGILSPRHAPEGAINQFFLHKKHENDDPKMKISEKVTFWVIFGKVG